MADKAVIHQGIPQSALDQDPESYPDSDGKPMAENGRHFRAIHPIRAPLETRCRGSEDTYLTGDLLLYYKRHHKRACLAPDVMVVLGVSPAERRSYRLWEESKAPDFVAEVSSPDSFEHDSEKRRRLYGEIGVQEYFRFKPGYGASGRSGVMHA